MPHPLTAFRELEKHYSLWKATGDETSLAEAKRRLEALIQTAPPAYQASMRDGLPVYREILGA